MPVLITPNGVHLTRDLSADTLRARARGRSLHAPALSAGDLYDVCGEANEFVRNKRFKPDFCVVWVGDTPPDVLARDSHFSQDVADEAVLFLCVGCDSSGTSYVVLWLDGVLVAACTDEGLRASHAVLSEYGMSEDSFRAMPSAQAKLKEWSATRAAAVVCTAARAWCVDADVFDALEQLPASDAFVVQHDGVAKCAEAAMADVLASGTGAGAETPFDGPPPQLLESPRVAVGAFNEHVRMFF